ncbi:hypothetical protein [Saccharobesus litoralis]|uniref:hypothetical protein n=1 Tax=Saccharobesus litoralis TaxID=2172099 RepID=UPI00131ED572|nr:hypothetical protein [Saccharobesus litoralis]
MKSYIDDFKDYWFNGYNPRIGKDIATARPNPPIGHRHTHLKPSIFPLSTKPAVHKKSTKAYWNRWLTNRLISPPTSDRCLFYMVSNSRIAYVFHYQSEKSHQFMESIKFKEIVYKMETLAFQYNIDLMGFDDQQNLFSNQWLITT